MRLPKITFALLVLFALPTVASAGPIEFELTPRGFWADPEQPVLAFGLYPIFDGGTYTVDPTTGMATPVGPLVRFDYTRLPPPRPIDLHSDGSGAFWNNSGYFRVDYRLTDVASGEFADLSTWGRAHAGAQYYNGQWQYGGATYWFGSSDHLQYATLGGHDYVLWGQQRFTGEEPTISVWVGPNPPVPWVPEPGTFVLAALGFVAVGARAVRARLTRAVSG